MGRGLIGLEMADDYTVPGSGIKRGGTERGTVENNYYKAKLVMFMLDGH